ncbi:hypothetical protein CFOL_v3_35698 [Cephalotus follicularis]|uniref:Uncharacterized protein n=1 Tax=Cephalotus follicularis TaxID=3775 RepID=A0A1Q3DJC2_CEPFO|nr:hypothetical protein CFOL_v3_35698 [Cephalotus follicularis]
MSQPYTLQKILFAFNEKPITKEINLLKTFSLFKGHSVKMIEAKENHLSNKKLENQSQDSQIKEKIDSLKNSIINNLCSDLPDAFWHRKRHMVSLPYEKDFTEQNIHIKVRPIQMTYELIKHCKKEIQELLNKKLIRLSKSPLSYAVTPVPTETDVTITWQASLRNPPRDILNLIKKTS